MLTHKGTQTIYTDRLTLRRFEPTDAEAMFHTWANDARVTKYLTWTPHESVAFTKQLIDGWCAAYENLNTYNWAIETDGRLIGNISVVNINEPSEYVDLGYCIGHDHWGKGIMTEAVKAVIDFLFCEIGVNRVGICHAVKNPASGRVARKCGLTYEGTMREHFKTASGEFLDLSYYGILRSEWSEML